MTTASLEVRLDPALPALVRARLAAYADDGATVVDGGRGTGASAHGARGRVVVRPWTGTVPDDVPTVWLVDDASRVVMPTLARGIAAGWLPLDAEPWRVLAAARAVHEGFVALAPGLLRDAAPRARRAPRPVAPDERTSGDAVEGAPLTEREREVLRALAEGLGNKQVAARLGIGTSTVKSHLEAIYAKLGAHTRSEAVARAMRAGLVPL